MAPVRCPDDGLLRKSSVHAGFKGTVCKTCASAFACTVAYCYSGRVLPVRDRRTAHATGMKKPPRRRFDKVGEVCPHEFNRGRVRLSTPRRASIPLRWPQPRPTGRPGRTAPPVARRRVLRWHGGQMKAAASRPPAGSRSRADNELDPAKVLWHRSSLPSRQHEKHLRRWRQGCRSRLDVVRQATQRARVLATVPLRWCQRRWR